MFRQIGPMEIILIVLVIVLLFGGRKLPEAARGLGRSLKIFKAETKGLVNDDDGADVQEPTAPQTHQQPPAVTAVPQQPTTVQAQPQADTVTPPQQDTTPRSEG